MTGFTGIGFAGPHIVEVPGILAIRRQHVAKTIWDVSLDPAVVDAAEPAMAMPDDLLFRLGAASHPDGNSCEPARRMDVMTSLALKRGVPPA